MSKTTMKSKIQCLKEYLFEREKTYPRKSWTKKSSEVWNPKLKDIRI